MSNTDTITATDLSVSILPDPKVAGYTQPAAEAARFLVLDHMADHGWRSLGPHGIDGATLAVAQRIEWCRREGLCG